MKKEVVNSPKIGKAFSSTTCHATKAGGFLFITGQVANPPDVGGNPHSTPEMGGIEQQATQVMENLKAILEEAGTSFDNVLKRNVYLTHINDFDPVYKVMQTYLTSPHGQHRHPRRPHPPSARLEIELIAVIPD